MSKEKSARNKNRRLSKKLKQFIEDNKKRQEQEDLLRIKDSKAQNKIRYQNELMGIYLKRKVKEELIKYMDELLKYPKDEYLFNGVSQSKGMMESQRELEVFYYKDLLMQEETHKSELKKIGFSDENIIEVLSGKYIKDTEQLYKMEDDLMKPQIELSKKFNTIMIEIQKLKEKLNETKDKDEKVKIESEISSWKKKLEEYDKEVLKQNAKSKTEKQ